MSVVQLNSVEDLKNCGPGVYSVPYGKFRFNVRIGTIDQNASINLDGYGQGGGKGNSVLDAYIGNENNSVDIVMTHSSGSNAYDVSGWRQAAGNFMRDVATNLNLNQNNTMLMGFSYSAERTVPFAAEYAANNNASNFSAVIIESSCTPPTVLTDAQRQSLIDHNVTVYNVYQGQKKGRSLLSTSHLQNYEGVHIIDVQVNVQNSSGDYHMLPYEVLLDSGITTIGNGDFSFQNLPTKYTVTRKSSPYFNKTFSLEYNFIEHYYDENGKYTSRQLTAAEVEQISKSGKLGNYSLPKTSDNFQITSKQSDVAKKYSSLKYLDDLSLKTSGTAVSSEYATVESMVQNLRNQIKSTNFFDSLKEYTFRSSEGILGTIQSYLEKYYDTVGTLIQNLASESESVLSYAQAMIDMDQDLKTNAGNIGTIYEGQPTLSISPPASTTTPTTTPTTTTTKTEVNEPTSSETYTPTSYYYSSSGESSGGSRSSSPSTSQSTQTTSQQETAVTTTEEIQPTVTETPTETTIEAPTEATAEVPAETPAVVETPSYTYVEPQYTFTPQVEATTTTVPEVQATHIEETTDLPFDIAYTDSNSENYNPYIDGMNSTTYESVPLPTETATIEKIQVQPTSSNTMTQNNSASKNYLNYIVGIGAAGAVAGGAAFTLKKMKEKENEINEEKESDELEQGDSLD